VGQRGYPCTLNKVKWVVKGGAVVADKTEDKFASEKSNRRRTPPFKNQRRRGGAPAMAF